MRRFNPFTGLRPRIAALVLGGVVVLAAIMVQVSAHSVNGAYEPAIDLDDFNAINGAGHAVGDEALRAVAAALRDELRAGDICRRVGVLLTDRTSALSRRA